MGIQLADHACRHEEAGSANVFSQLPLSSLSRQGDPPLPLHALAPSPLYLKQRRHSGLWRTSGEGGQLMTQLSCLAILLQLVYLYRTAQRSICVGADPLQIQDLHRAGCLQ